MNSTVVVPRIIHQTWKTADVPKWADHARKCVSLAASCLLRSSRQCGHLRLQLEKAFTIPFGVRLKPSTYVRCRECLRLHPGYEYKFWTDASARQMIAEGYPEYLPMYDGYKYGIQVSL